jgi:glycosyltransferase involved in cell wall biosynthesis
MATEQQQSAGTNPTPDAVKTGLEIAVVSPGDRTEELTQPMTAVGIDHSVNPENLTEHDIVICDTPDRDMLRAVVECRVAGTPVLFRARGDPFWGIDEWLTSRVKKGVLFRMLRAVDGCIAIAPHQGTKFARKCQVPVEIVTLSESTSRWPDTSHEGETLRIITLTNAVYPEKVNPLAEIAPIVETELSGNDVWRIGSWSTGHEQRLRKVADEHEHIEFGLGLDAWSELEAANLMIHHSRLDALPNAVLEGMSSRLPVLTNSHVAFRQSAAPTEIARSNGDLRAQLMRYRDPRERQATGDAGHRFINDRHDPERVGQELRDAIRRVVGV